MKPALRGFVQRLQPWLTPLFLLGVCLLAYGLWVPRMGFYWDDFPISWIQQTYGDAGLERYFSTVRPVWGLLYRLTMPVVGAHPLPWQIFAILWRWISGLLLWQLLRLTWPQRGEFAAWAAAFFLVYPGFSQQFISLVYSHFFIVLSAFLGSLALTVLAIRSQSPRKFWFYSTLALALCLFNLLSLEYFFFLELLRPLFIWAALKNGTPTRLSKLIQPDKSNKKSVTSVSSVSSVSHSLILWAPYAVLLLGVIAWRMFFFSSALYEPVFLDLLRTDFLAALAYLFSRMGGDAWLAVVMAWGNAFHWPTWQELTPNLMHVFYAVLASTSVLGVVYAALTPTPFPHCEKGERKEGRRDRAAPLLIGLFGLIVAGAPFWLTGLPVQLYFHYDRLTLAYMLPFVLVMLGLAFLFPLPGNWRLVRAVPLAVLLAFCVGYQYQQAIVYIRDWNVQQRLFWQLAWRMPGIQSGTILLSNELPLKHYSDNSLSAPLNLVFDPQNTSTQMSYALFYPTIRIGEESLIPSLEPGLPIQWDYLAASFSGNTSQVVAFYYNPPGCVRVLDPEIERDNYTLPRYLRNAMVLSTTDPILPVGSPEMPEGSSRLPAWYFGVQTENSWCHYFEKADLARQQGNWQAVVDLSEAGFATGDYPNDPVERVPAIEGYAHLGDWEHALEQSHLAAGVAPVYEMVVCRTWERIQRDVTPSLGRDQAYQAIYDEYRCGEPRNEPPPDPEDPTRDLIPALEPTVED